MNVERFKPGDALLLHDGSRVEVLAPSENRRSIRGRYVESPGDPSLIGTEVQVADREVSAFSPAPPGPEWGERVVVVVYHVPESEETEGGYEATTMGGVPLGVSITASDANTARESLDRLTAALKAFGYSGAVSVEDATYLGGVQRYDMQI